MKRIFVLLTVSLLSLGTFAACGHPPSKNGDATKELPGQGDTIYAIGWNDIVIQANWAKTTVDGLGHYVTTRNACGRDASGAMDLSAWSKFVIPINNALRQEPLTAQRCVPLSERPVKMDGVAEIATDQGKRILIDVRNSEMCTTISDQSLAVEVLQALDLVVNLADKEECPNGWGSG